LSGCQRPLQLAQALHLQREHGIQLTWVAYMWQAVTQRSL
jgi:hypothetical protein